LVPLSAEYFEGNREQPTKRPTARRLKKLQGYQTVLDSQMAGLESGDTTRLLIEDIRHDRDLPDKLFNRRSPPSDDRIEQRHRP
jgi:hypothetical protein